METEDLLRRVRRIEIKARRLSSNIFAGEYHSVFKGKGMSFSEVREYQYGDDIRDIDWNVTARFNKPYVKVYEEERELTVLLLIDVSASLDFGTQKASIRQIVAEIAATLSFSAIQNNDKIGVVFFSDKVEKFIPPKSGRKHILFIIRELLRFQPQSRKTDVAQAIRFLMNVQRTTCTAFLISDFVTHKDLTDCMSMAGRKYDMNAIQVYDQRMAELPSVGLIRICDLETGQELLVDSSSTKVRNFYHQQWTTRRQNLKATLDRCNVRNVSVRTDEDYVKSLIMLFSKKQMP